MCEEVTWSTTRIDGGEKLRKSLKLLISFIVIFGFIVVPATARPDDPIKPPPVLKLFSWYDYEPLGFAYATGGPDGEKYSSAAEGKAWASCHSPFLDFRNLVGNQFDLGVGTESFILTTGGDHTPKMGYVSFDMNIEYNVVSYPNYMQLPWGWVLVGYGGAQIVIELVMIEVTDYGAFEYVLSTIVSENAENGQWKSDSLDFNLDDTFATGYLLPYVSYYFFEVRVSMYHTWFAGCFASIDIDTANVRVWYY